MFAFNPYSMTNWRVERCHKVFNLAEGRLSFGNPHQRSGAGPIRPGADQDLFYSVEIAFRHFTSLRTRDFPDLLLLVTDFGHSGIQQCLVMSEPPFVAIDL